MTFLLSDPNQLPQIFLHVIVFFFWACIGSDFNSIYIVYTRSVYNGIYSAAGDLFVIFFVRACISNKSYGIYGVYFSFSAANTLGVVDVWVSWCSTSFFRDSSNVVTYKNSRGACLSTAPAAFCGQHESFYLLSRFNEAFHIQTE